MTGSDAAYQCIGWLAAGALGLITGSFLNAVIHRLPRGISLLHPKRSFCPGCEKMIPWHENLPVASWMLLRGRCSECAMPIGLRYPLVELLTSILYLLAWGSFGLPLAPVAWIFLSLLVAATFIDIDHLIIPDEITLGGTAAGILLSPLLPGLNGGFTRGEALIQALAGAACGYFALWGVVELGKIAFGRRRIRPDTPLPMEIKEQGGAPLLVLGEESLFLEELIYRPSDRVEALCTGLAADGVEHGAGKLILGGGRLRHVGASSSLEWALDTLGDVMPVRAEVTEITLPREAMGFGDVKFLACIGAFLGWKGVLFSVFAGSVAGSLVGISVMAVTRGRSGGRIPFGPYLALGAALWLLWGPDLMDLYAALSRGEAAFFLHHADSPL